MIGLEWGSPCVLEWFREHGKMVPMWVYIVAGAIGMILLVAYAGPPIKGLFSEKKDVPPDVVPSPAMPPNDRQTSCSADDVPRARPGPSGRSQRPDSERHHRTAVA